MWWWLWPMLLVLAVIALRVVYIYMIAPPEQPWDPKSQK